MRPGLRVTAPGLLSTIQDLGRPGYRKLGIPTGGALDPVALRAANILVGNEPGAGAIEIAYLGPTFVVEADATRISFFGAEAAIDVFASVDASEAKRVRTGRTILARRGQVIKVGAIVNGAIMYMAVEGGFDLSPVMGSLSTYLRGRIGGYHGRALMAGDLIPLTIDTVEDRLDQQLALPQNWTRRRFRVVDGPQRDFIAEESAMAFFASEYTVGAASDRMGMRLNGQPLHHRRGFNIVSDAIAPGSIQVPGDGLPIVLMRDHQTIGGYPKFATVITADLPALGRTPSGAKISFERVGMEEAESALGDHRREIADLKRRLSSVSRGPAEIAALLNNLNLISGAISAHA